MKCFSLILTILSFSFVAFPQSDTIFNQTDANNLKQGYWKKNYPNGQLMYKGFFRNDRPSGEMRRYSESGALKAVLNYNHNGEYAHARLFYEDGSLAAEGLYYNTLKDSIWIYYSYYTKTISAMETYEKGVLHGMMTHYYSNGDVSERIQWQQNKKSGIWEQYFKGNMLKLKANYVNNKLEREFVVYTSNGKPYIAGNYKNDLREGKWTFYNEDGTVQDVLNYQSGKAADDEKLNAEQQEFFRMIDEAQGKFTEPDETDFLAP